MKIHTDVNEMGMIGAADYVVVLSDPDTCVVRVVAECGFKQGKYIQVIPSEMIYELHYTQLEYPVNPRIIAIGDKASKKLGRMRHYKILLNEWRAM